MKPNETTSKMEEEQAKTSVLNSESSVVERANLNQEKFLHSITNGKTVHDDLIKKHNGESHCLIIDPNCEDKKNFHLDRIHAETSFVENLERAKETDLGPATLKNCPRLGNSFPDTKMLYEKKSRLDPKSPEDDPVCDYGETHQKRKILVATERRQDLLSKNDHSKPKKSPPSDKTGQENGSDNKSSPTESSLLESKRPDRKCKNLTKALMMLTYSDDFVFYDDAVARMNNHHKESKTTSKRNQITKEPKSEDKTEQPTSRSQAISEVDEGKSKPSEIEDLSKSTDPEVVENETDVTDLEVLSELEQLPLPKNRVKGLKKRGRRRSTLANKKHTIKTVKNLKAAPKQYEAASKIETSASFLLNGLGGLARKLEDCLPDLIEPRSSRQPSRRSLEAEKCSAIIEHVIEGDRHFCCFSCLKYFASFHQFSDHKNSLVCVPGLQTSIDQKATSDVTNHGSILTCNSYNACKSKTNRFDDSCDTEYSKFTSEAPGRIPEVTFNGMHGKIDHIESKDAQIFRSKINLNETEKFKMNINTPWTTKEVWESGGGWELSDRDYLSWHKYENRWSDSRRFLMSMSHLPWSEQIKFKKVFDLAVSTKLVKRPAEESSVSDGPLKKFPGKRKHNSLMGAIGLRQTSKSAKYMSINEREELKQKAIRRELVSKQSTDINSSRSNLNGEWERDHFFVCGACSEHFDDLGKAMSHKWDAHPYCLVAHVICQSELSEPPSGFTYPQTGRQLAPDRGVLVLPKRTSSNYARKASNVQPNKCTKCLETNFLDREAFRIHILECGGLTNWNSPTTKKKKRSKRTKNIGNSKLIKRTHSRDGTESDDSGGMNNFNQVAALKRKQRFERFNQPPPMRDVGVGRFTRLQAVRIKTSTKRGRRRKINAKLDTKINKNDSEPGAKKIKSDSSLKYDDIKAKRLRLKETRLAASLRPRRSVGNYTLQTLLEEESLSVALENEQAASSIKTVETKPSPTKEQESLKTAKALMSEMLEKVEKAVEVVKKAEEFNISIESVRGRMADLGNDRNRKRKSSAPTRIIPKTSDNPVDIHSPGENVSSKNGSSRDCPLKLRLEEEEEKVKKDNEMMMRPEPEKSPPNVSPVGINIANDENIKPSKDKEDADSERAKYEFVKEYLSRVALVQALKKQIMMRDTISQAHSPTVASFIEARRSLLNSAAQHNLKSFVSKPQPDTNALIQTAQAQALFKAQMSNFLKPIDTSPFDVLSPSGSNDKYKDGASSPSSAHLLSQPYVESPILNKLQSSRLLSQSLQATAQSSHIQSLPNIITQHLQSRDPRTALFGKTDMLASLPRSLFSPENNTEKVLAPTSRKSTVESRATHQPDSSNSLTDYQFSHQALIQKQTEQSPLGLLLTGKRTPKTSVSTLTKELNQTPRNLSESISNDLQADCQPEDLSIKKKSSEEKKITTSQNPFESSLVTNLSSGEKPDTVRIIRVNKQDKTSVSSISTSQSASVPVVSSDLKEIKDTKIFNKFAECKHNEGKPKRSKTDPACDFEFNADRERPGKSKASSDVSKLEPSNIINANHSSKTQTTNKKEKPSSPGHNKDIQTPQEMKLVRHNKKEKYSPVHKNIQSPNEIKLVEKPIKNRSNLKIPPGENEHEMAVKKSSDSQEYDFKEEDSMLIEPMIRSVGRTGTPSYGAAKSETAIKTRVDSSERPKGKESMLTKENLELDRSEATKSERRTKRALSTPQNSIVKKPKKEFSNQSTLAETAGSSSIQKETKFESESDGKLNGFKSKNEGTVTKKDDCKQETAPTPRKRGRPPKQKLNSDPVNKVLPIQTLIKTDVFDFQIDEDDNWSDSFRRPKKISNTCSLLSLGTQPSEAKSDEVIAPPDIKTEDEPAVMPIFTSEKLPSKDVNEKDEILFETESDEPLLSVSPTLEDFDTDEEDCPKSIGGGRRRSSFANSFYALMPMRKTLRRTAARISMERASEREAFMNVIFDESDQSNDAKSQSEKSSGDDLFNKLIKSGPKSNCRNLKQSQDDFSKLKGRDENTASKEKKKRGRKPKHLLNIEIEVKKEVVKVDPFDELVTSSKPQNQLIKPTKAPEVLPEKEEPVKLSPRQKRKRFISTPSTSTNKRRSSSYDDIAVYQAGLSVSEISKLTGIPEELLEMDRPKRSRRSLPVEMDANRTIYPLEVRSFAVDRIRNGVTQVQVARDLDCPVSTVASWWNKRKQIKLALDPNAILSDSDDESDIIHIKTKKADKPNLKPPKTILKSKNSSKGPQKVGRPKKQATLASVLKRKGTNKRKKSFSASMSSIESFHAVNEETIGHENESFNNVSEVKSDERINLDSQPYLKPTANETTESEETDDDDEDEERSSAATVGNKNKILKHCFASMAARGNQ